MKLPPFRPQFDPRSFGQNRKFERLFLVHHNFNFIVARGGKFALSCLLWPRFVAPFRWELTRYPITLAGLSPEFLGYKILHLTDLHVGRTRNDYLHSVFQRCLEEKPDLVVITGDLIDYHAGNLELLDPLLTQLTAANVPDGILAIFGNHDYHEYSWRHNGQRSAHRAIHKRLVTLLHHRGIRLLRNESHRVSRNNHDLIIVGLDEMWTDRADPAKAFHGITPADPVICLQHNPDGFEFLKPFPWQYMLCGHTHGGQANFPFLGPMYVPMKHREFIKGHFHFDPLPGQSLPRRTMFVSRGLGYSTPIRLRCRPEATLFTLTSTQ